MISVNHGGDQVSEGKENAFILLIFFSFMQIFIHACMHCVYVATPLHSLCSFFSFLSLTLALPGLCLQTRRTVCSLSTGLSAQGEAKLCSCICGSDPWIGFLEKIPEPQPQSGTSFHSQFRFLLTMKLFWVNQTAGQPTPLFPLPFVSSSEVT